jgi:hypothetical protein
VIQRQASKVPDLFVHPPTGGRAGLWDSAAMFMGMVVISRAAVTEGLFHILDALVSNINVSDRITRAGAKECNGGVYRDRKILCLCIPTAHENRLCDFTKPSELIYRNTVIYTEKP